MLKYWFRMFVFRVFFLSWFWFIKESEEKDRYALIFLRRIGILLAGAGWMAGYLVCKVLDVRSAPSFASCGAIGAVIAIAFLSKLKLPKSFGSFKMYEILWRPMASALMASATLIGTIISFFPPVAGVITGTASIWAFCLVGGYVARKKRVPGYDYLGRMMLSNIRTFVEVVVLIILAQHFLGP